MNDLPRINQIGMGLIYDVTPVAASVGFTAPAAISQALYWDLSTDVDRSLYEERVKDIFETAYGVIKKSQRLGKPNMSLIKFIAGVQDPNITGGANGMRYIDLAFMVGPGDEKEPVITVYFIDEL